jgi:hypothetical protein
MERLAPRRDAQRKRACHRCRYIAEARAAPEIMHQRGIAQRGAGTRLRDSSRTRLRSTTSTNPAPCSASPHPCPSRVDGRTHARAVVASFELLSRLWMRSIWRAASSVPGTHHASMRRNDVPLPDPLVVDCTCASGAVRGDRLRSAVGAAHRSFAHRPPACRPAAQAAREITQLLL